MISIIPNMNNKCNFEFKKYVNIRVANLNSKGFIVCSIQYKKNPYNQLTGAIINYKERII